MQNQLAATPKQTIPTVFALRPLRNTLVACANLMIKPMNAEGTLGVAVPFDYRNTDIELLAQKFVCDVDRFTAVPFVSTANTSLQRTCMEDVLAAKQKLACAIARGLDFIFDPSSSPAQASASSAEMREISLEAARELLRQCLVSSLADGYSVRAVVQSDGRATLLRDADLHSPSNTLVIDDKRVAMPLREWPATPQLLAHATSPTHARAENYTHAMLWDYALRYRYEGKVADQLHIAVECGASVDEVSVNPNAVRACVNENDETGLLQSLAQYVSVAPTLWGTLNDALNCYRADNRTIDKVCVANTMRTFAALVDDVADKWLQYGFAAKRAVPKLLKVRETLLERYCFTQTLDVRDDVERGRTFYTSLHLQRTRADGELDWPLLSVLSSDGQWASMGRGVDAPQGREYKMPSNVDGAGPIELEMRFDALHVGSYQCGTAQVQVVRNANLCADIATRPAFVCEADWVSMPSAFVPDLHWSEAIDIGEWEWNADANPLNAFFSTLFGARIADRQIGCDVRYEYVLAAAMPIATASLPVLLKVESAFTTTTVKELSSALREWFDRKLPPTQGARWIVKFTLFASNHPKRPVLQLLLGSNLRAV